MSEYVLVIPGPLPVSLNRQERAVTTVSKRFTAEEFAKLREIAEAATPGPWRIPGANVFRVVAPETQNQGDPYYRWAVIADADPSSVDGEQAAANVCYIAAFHPPTVLALLDEIEQLWREREVLVETLMPASEALTDLDKGYYRVAKQDPAGYVMGSVSVASLVTVIESTRKALALLDGEKGVDGLMKWAQTATADELRAKVEELAEACWFAGDLLGSDPEAMKKAWSDHSADREHFDWVHERISHALRVPGGGERG